MSTYHSAFARRKSTKLTSRAAYCVSYCITCGVLTGLIAVLSALFLSPIALATQHDVIPQQEYLARTGVSLVRIIATYSVTLPNGGGISLTPGTTPPKGNLPSANSIPSVPCTGIGAIVAGTGQKIWVATDGSLLNTNALTCKTTGLPGPTPGFLNPTKDLKLTTIKVYINNTYNSALSSTPFSGDIASIHCSDTKNCGDGVSLFSFQSKTPLPAISLANATSVAQANIAAIQLSQSLTNTVPPTETTTNFQQYVTPTTVPVSGTSHQFTGLEGGTPIVDGHGFLNSISLKNATTQAKLVTTADIAALLTRQNIKSDTTATALSENWNDGITDYYQGGASQYGKANSDFTTAYNASNAQFQAAHQFAQATTKTGTLGETTDTPGTTNETSPGITLPILGFRISYLLLAIIAVGFVALVVLLFSVNALFRGAQRRKDIADADKLAEAQAQQIREMEAQQAPAHPIPPRAKQNIQHAAPYPAQQATNGVMNGASLAPVVPIQSSTIADFPTLDMSEAKQNGMLDIDKTQPFPPGLQRGVRGGGEEPMGFEVITSTNPGIKRQYKPNEDSLFALRGMLNAKGHMQQVGLFVVADGMGGHANGQDASRLAIQTIIDYILPRLVHGNDASETPEKLLVDSVQLANQAVHQHNIENNADMGTTVTATLVVDTTAHVANVGDSRTYLYRTSKLDKVTRDHSVVASLVDAGIIKPDDIYTHPKRNQIYRSLGEKPFVEVDPFEVQLQPGDKLLLCSDGLWDMVRDPEIKRVLETPTPDPQQLGDNLIKAALHGGGEDNVSVIVINVVDHLSKPLTPGLETIYIQDNVKMPPL